MGLLVVGAETKAAEALGKPTVLQNRSGFTHVNVVLMSRKRDTCIPPAVRRDFAVLNISSAVIQRLEFALVMTEPTGTRCWRPRQSLSTLTETTPFAPRRAHNDGMVGTGGGARRKSSGKGSLFAVCGSQPALMSAFILHSRWLMPWSAYAADTRTHHVGSPEVRGSR